MCFNIWENRLGIIETKHPTIRAIFGLTILVWRTGVCFHHQSAIVPESIEVISPNNRRQQYHPTMKRNKINPCIQPQGPQRNPGSIRLFHRNAQPAPCSVMINVARWRTHWSLRELLRFYTKSTGAFTRPPSCDVYHHARRRVAMEQAYTVLTQFCSREKIQNRKNLRRFN